MPAAECKTNGPAKESPIGPEVAVGSGYSESKWVSERLLEIAAAETPLQPTIIRVGQICGGPNGFWNDKEWVPSLIRSSIHLKCLPSSEQVNSHEST
jgi:thioester reductase-like protein